jgi:hypothetical protein
LPAKSPSLSYLRGCSFSHVLFLSRSRSDLVRGACVRAPFSLR